MSSRLRFALIIVPCLGIGGIAAPVLAAGAVAAFDDSLTLGPAAKATIRKSAQPPIPAPRPAWRDAPPAADGTPAGPPNADQPAAVPTADDAATPPAAAEPATPATPPAAEPATPTAASQSPAAAATTPAASIAAVATPTAPTTVAETPAVAIPGSSDPQQLFAAGKAAFTKDGATVDEQAEALKLLFHAADLGSAPAMNLLATIFATDPHIRDIKQSFAWDLRAAQAGDTLSMTRVGNDYIDGTGVAKDAKAGVDWYRKGIALGSAAAMNGLAGAYQNGWGVDQDINQAVSWYQKAADGGHPQANFMLGVSYLTGEGHPKDPKKAADYIYAALRKGYGQALSALLNTPTPDPDFARGLQQHLVKDGFFKGPVNGSFGTVTKTAMKAAFGTDKG